MEDFLILTCENRRQGLLGPIPETWTATEVKSESVEDIVKDLKVPLEGYSLVLKKDDVTLVTSEIVNRIAEDGPPTR